MRQDRLPPFSTRLVERDEDDQLLSLLPATYRTKSDDLAAPARHVDDCVERELNLRRLSSIHAWLWVAGRPMPPRPLHYQLLLSREIFITERMDMHLVWTTGRIFLKPIPHFLLEPRFWAEYLSANDDGSDESCERGLRKRALGFLFSYVALISYESDFLIAKEKHLLPAEVRWPNWRRFVEELDTEHIYPDIDARFYYGELRLGRLNTIYFISQTPLRGYMSRWNQYGSFFQDNFAWLAGTTIYIAIVLTAMQVGLATERLAGNHVFQSVSYGFTVFSILGPLIVAGFIFTAFFYLFINNWIATVVFGKERFNRIHHCRSAPH